MHTLTRKISVQSFRMRSTQGSSSNMMEWEISLKKPRTNFPMTKTTDTYRPMILKRKLREKYLHSGRAGENRNYTTIRQNHYIVIPGSWCSEHPPHPALCVCSYHLCCNEQQRLSLFSLSRDRGHSFLCTLTQYELK